ncbi:MAG TPA: ABC transporter permease [Terriglobia bacterium]|nr:ABC transporter permease [Terriglobia bacterium]
MHKIWLVFKREYITRVRTKAFIFGTIALPLLALVILTVSVFLSGTSSAYTVRLAILDEAGGLAGTVKKTLLANAANKDQPDVQVIETLEQPSPEQKAHLLSQIESGDIEAFLVLPKGLIAGKVPAELHARNFRAMTLLGPVQRAVSVALITRRLTQEGKQAGDMKNVFELAHVQLVNVMSGKEENDSGDDTFIVAIAAGMLLYMTLIIYGMSTMRSVMEEKSTRIVEILVSSIKPFDLLTGKIASVGAVALTQYLIWGITLGAIMSFGSRFARLLRPGAAAPAFHIPPVLLIYLVVFFLAGYFLYASLYAAAGAIVSTDEEARQAQMPLTLLIMGSFLLFNIVLNDPNSTLSVVLSVTPFLSPILMTLRVAIVPPPFWQIALAIGLSIAATFVVIRISARIYRVGILMHGKRPSLKELRRWLRYT